MSIRQALVVAAALGIIAPSSSKSANVSKTDVGDCQHAIYQYRSAVSDVSSDLRFYANCVSGSHGHDDCSSEFFSLQSAQDDFESAVSSYRSDCD